MPPLTAEQACELAVAFCTDLLSALSAVPGIELRLAAGEGQGDAGVEVLEELAARCGVAVERQGSGDLGARMQRLVERGVDAGKPTILVGSDVPDLPPGRIASALASLERVDAVLVPALDGGYVLVGARRRLPALFRIDAPWSSEQVFAATCRSLEKSGCTFETLAPWEDVDDAAALGRLAFRLGSGGGAPATARLIAQWRREGVRF